MFAHADVKLQIRRMNKLDFLDYVLKLAGALFMALILVDILGMFIELLSRFIRKKKNHDFKVKVEPCYQISHDKPYEWVYTDNGKDLIIHFDKENK